MAGLILEHFLPYRMSIASNAVSGVIATAYETLFGLRIPEWRLVAVLAEIGPATPQGVGAATRMDKVTVSRAAAALIARGLVARSPHGQDRRSHLLALTEAGRVLYGEVGPKALALEAELLRGFAADEIAGFTDMLERLEAAAVRMGGA
jgi:DNA-binding MarR family transcriptional regulator